MTDSILVLPAHLRNRLAQALESGILGMNPTPTALRAALGETENIEDVSKTLSELAGFGIEGPVAAKWIRELERVGQGAPRPDLVWSGPRVPGIYARNTRQVFEELIESAQRSILVSTYAFFDGPKAFEGFARQMETNPELRVTLLLNIQRRRGETRSASELVRRFADRFWAEDWPGSVKPAVYYDPRALEPDGPSGVLHAKALIVDEKAILVTSANLTEAALDRNFELGLLVRDRALSVSVSSHFFTLIEKELLLALPAK